MRLWIFIIVIAPVMAFNPIYAQSSLQYTQSVGFAAGLVSGTGLAYRGEVGPRAGFQIAGGMLIYKEHISYSIGGQLLITLRKGPQSRLYALAGLGVHDSSEGDDESFMGYDVDNQSLIAVGAGIGWEVFYSRYGMGLSLEIPITFIPDIPLMMPLPQLALQYYFQ